MKKKKSYSNGQVTTDFDEQGRPIWGRNGKGFPVCFAVRQNGKNCMKDEREANGRCLLHGGRALAGLAHPQYIDGKTARGIRHVVNLPARMQEDFEQSMNDRAQVELRPEIALVDSRIAELTRSLSESNALASLLEIKNAFNAVRQATQTGDSRKVAGATAHLERMIENGAKDSDTWTEIIRQIETRRKLIDTEVRRLAQSQSMLSIGVVRQLTAQLIEIVKTAVIGNLEKISAVTPDELEVKMKDAKIDAAYLSVILAAIVPTLNRSYDKARNLILSEISEGIGRIYEARQSDRDAS